MRRSRHGTSGLGVDVVARARRTTLRVARVVLGAVAVVTLATGCGSVAANGGTAGESTPTPIHATMPTDPSGITPESTITDFIAGVNAHDMVRAEGLVAPKHVSAILDRPDGWFTNTVNITELSLGAPVAKDGHGTAADGYAQVLYVPARFTLAEQKSGGTSTSRVSWGFLLARQSMVARWIIVDEGPA